MSKRMFPCFSIFILFMSSLIWGAEDIKQIIFEEQRIEGKIRRPQLVHIKAEQRPEFIPMVLHGFGKNSNVITDYDEKLIEDSPFRDPFRFQRTKISNYIP